MDFINNTLRKDFNSIKSDIVKIEVKKIAHKFSIDVLLKNEDDTTSYLFDTAKQRDADAKILLDLTKMELSE